MLKDTCVLGELQGSSYIMELELLNSARAVLVLLGQLWYRLNWAQGFVIVVQKLVWLCRVGCTSTGLLFGFFFLPLFAVVCLCWLHGYFVNCLMKCACLSAVWRLFRSLCPWDCTVLNFIWLSARIWGAHCSAKWLFMSQVVWHGQGQDEAEQLYWALPNIYRILGIFLHCTVL